MEPIPVRGLVSKGETCYLNAVLQVLLRNTDIMDCIDMNDKSDFKRQLFELREKFHNMDPGVVDPTDFINFAEKNSLGVTAGYKSGSSRDVMVRMLDKIYDISSDGNYKLDPTNGAQCNEVNRTISDFVAKDIVTINENEPPEIKNALDQINEDRQRINATKSDRMYKIYQWEEWKKKNPFKKTASVLDIIFYVNHKNTCKNGLSHSFFYNNHPTGHMIKLDISYFGGNLQKLFDYHVKQTHDNMKTEKYCECNRTRYDVEETCICWRSPPYIFIDIDTGAYKDINNYDKLEIGEYMENPSGWNVQYSLIATIWNHSDDTAREQRSHFTATIKVDNEWYHFDDSTVTKVQSAEQCPLQSGLERRYHMPIILEYKKLN